MSLLPFRLVRFLTAGIGKKKKVNVMMYILYGKLENLDREFNQRRIRNINTCVIDCITQPYCTNAVKNMAAAH